MLKFKLWKAVACLAVLVAGAGRGEAANYNLATLLAGGSFQSGDKEFYDFQGFTETGSKAPLGAANITLTTMSQPNRNLADPINFPLPAGQPACEWPCPTEYGFRMTGPFLVGQNETYNMGLDFKVRVLDPINNHCRMYANELELTGGSQGGGTVNVDENVTHGLISLANKSVSLTSTMDREYFTDNGTPICVPDAQISLSLAMSAPNVLNAQANVGHVDIFFAQAIPEPSTYALLLLGSAGVGLMVRRKRA